MSVNHQFPEYQDAVYARYKKTSTAAIGGNRLNPSDPKERMPFVLMSSFDQFDIETETLQFNYENDVIELYSEQEEKAFKRLNARLFKNGLIEVYKGDVPNFEDNTLSEEEIEKIASTKTLLGFKKIIEEIEELITIARIRDAVARLDRPASFSTAINERYERLSAQ